MGCVGDRHALQAQKMHNPKGQFRCADGENRNKCTTSLGGETLPAKTRAAGLFKTGGRLSGGLVCGLELQWLIEVPAAETKSVCRSQFEDVD